MMMIIQRYYEDGADMQIEMEVDGPDGVPDNPGQVVWEKPVRTDMSANNNFNYWSLCYSHSHLIKNYNVYVSKLQQPLK